MFERFYYIDDIWIYVSSMVVRSVRVVLRVYFIIELLQNRKHS